LLDAIFWVALVKVLAVNLILSGDNAVVIAMAARSLHGSQRRQAIIWGAALLIYIAVEMFFADEVLHHYLEPFVSIEWIIGLSAAAIFTAIAWLWKRRSESTE
jgi:predicted tellurium resistance membrane protein TerC